jgi:hypothetical protein
MIAAGYHLSPSPSVFGWIFVLLGLREGCGCKGKYPLRTS